MPLYHASCRKSSNEAGKNNKKIMDAPVSGKPCGQRRAFYDRIKKIGRKVPLYSFLLFIPHGITRRCIRFKRRRGNMKKLLVYLREYRKESILGPLFKLLEAGFELIVPLVVAAIIDRGIGAQDQRYIWLMCLVLVGLGLVGLLCSVTAQYFAAKAAPTRLPYRLEMMNTNTPI